MQQKFVLFSSVITSLFLTTPSIADTHLTYTDSIKDGSSKVTNIYIKGDKISSRGDNAPIYRIFDAKEQALYTINPQEKQYIKGVLDSIDSVKTMASEALKAREQMKAKLTEQMKTLPAEQRKAMEEQMKQLEAIENAPIPKIASEKTGKTETINGLECDVYQVTTNGTPSRESCITKTAIDENDLKTLQAMFGFMNKMAQENAAIRGQKTPDFSQLPSYSTGLALRIQGLPDGVKSELTQLNKNEVKTEMVSVPSDYTLFDPKQAAQQQAK
jgi:hypothetical protein